MDVQKLTVAIPVLNGGEPLRETLAALASQRNEAGVELEILIVDSGSTDGSLEAAHEAGATVIEIDKSTFQHGRTRNLAVREAKGDVVALLTDDATPASDRWLDAIVEGFAQADDVALVFGPQLPRPEHSPMVRREMIDHFKHWGHGDRPELQRIEDSAQGRADYEKNKGIYVFFSDANGAVARWAWEQIPYREVPYAEDQLIGREMLEAGYAKVFHPDAAVLHSHDYSAWKWLKRRFDDYRGVLEVFGHRSPIRPIHAAKHIVKLALNDRAYMRSEQIDGLELNLWTLRALRHHGLRQIGEWLGGRADRLPVFVCKRLSLDGRGGFAPASDAIPD